MTLEELTPREQRLIAAYHRLRALWPTRHGWWAIGASFALNTLAMAASSGLRAPEIWIFSALQAVVVTALCVAPSLIAYGFGVANRVSYRWTLLASILIAVANVASAVVGGFPK